MPYLFGGLVLLNAIALGYYLFLQSPTTTQSLKAEQAEITQPLSLPIVLSKSRRLLAAKTNDHLTLLTFVSAWG